MFLKHIDIIGFKSFAERVNIQFDSGITAVVGPNGSGKSNITDAIRWVLGEQSAKSLRGGKMEDVIFSGSDSRQALNFAEVTLTLQNEEHLLPIDYSEVSVTRRVYRSGESDFFINKQRCRLKDIVDLFMDSGLGRESFSIISQGKVEQVLNSKPEERRMIFEEAAGVLKYKTRKKHAENKLIETKDNLNRVNDIVHELESQLGPLSKQASIATDYLEKKSDLAKIEIALTAVEIEQLHEKWQTFKTELNEVTTAEVSLSAAIQIKESELVKVNENIFKLDEEINELQQLLLTETEELEKLAGQKGIIAERQRNTYDNKQQLQTNINDLNEKIDNLIKEKAAVTVTESEITNYIAQIKHELNENDNKLSQLSAGTIEQLENVKNEYFEMLTEQANNNNELKYLEQQHSQLKQRQLQMMERNEAHLNERAEVKKAKQLTEKSLREVEIKIKKALDEFNNVRKVQQEISNKKTQQTNKLNALIAAVQQTKSRQEILAEMEEDFAGFIYGVKQVLKEKDKKLTGIFGAVAQLIDVPEQYEIAMEIALGAAMQHIVVKEELNARDAISYLTNNSYGRATFLPLTIIRGRSIAAEQLKTVENHHSYVGLASELINYDKKYSNIISNLLGTVIITTNLKGANELAKLLNYRYRIVTLDGNIVHSGGSMTGGAVKQKTTSLLSRKTELKDLKNKLQQLNEQVTQSENELILLNNELIKYDEKLESIREKGEQLRIQEQIIKGNIREIEVSEKNINDRLTLFDLDNEQIETELTGIIEKSAALKDISKNIAGSLAEKDNQIAILSRQKDDEHSSREKFSTIKSELQIKLNLQEQALNNCREKLATITKEIAMNENKRQDEENNLITLISSFDENVSSEDELSREISKMEHKKSELTESISSKRQQRFNLHQSVKDLEYELKGSRIKQQQYVQTINNKEIKVNRLDVELDNLLTYLREEYSLTYEGAKQQYELSTTVDQARKQVKLIKRAIDELGVVNIGAIDEYARIQERYDFLVEQKADLNEAMSNLYEIITEMDEEMKKRFSETFNDVKVHFEPVFQALFGGGRASLVLSDPDDMLNTGVDIIAQPPGKKLQNLALLSGGERALTAIALLFSILKVRPVPFCVLDEVEAALDEANVQRFADYLKKFSAETQFIVITHRKGTMEGADVLYGITMQESGVSKLVSVRLEDTEQLA